MGGVVSPLSEVYTSREAAEKWGLSENTVTQWCNRSSDPTYTGKKFLPNEFRKSGKIWLVTKAGMERLTGRKLP
ncbi:helix-turn-helix domain-containing protein [Laceyella sacchari]|uniref:helix-turn-helix domain-containing protein n=1 Tax=Laceyella sacchari TaxID=37482 RepID=UPI0010526513|nr:helix-turn-helix domain-containing protein [Laceyella sacchari]